LSLLKILYVLQYINSRHGCFLSSPCNSIHGLSKEALLAMMWSGSLFPENDH
jgi:hypothetical protein